MNFLTCWLDTMETGENCTWEGLITNNNRWKCSRSSFNVEILKLWCSDSCAGRINTIDDCDELLGKLSTWLVNDDGALEEDAAGNRGAGGAWGTEICGLGLPDWLCGIPRDFEPFWSPLLLLTCDCCCCCFNSWSSFSNLLVSLLCSSSSRFYSIINNYHQSA